MKQTSLATSRDFLDEEKDLFVGLRKIFPNPKSQLEEASGLPVPSFLGTNIMLRVDVASPVVPCDMYVSIKKIEYSFAQVDSCNTALKLCLTQNRNNATIEGVRE